MKRKQSQLIDYYIVVLWNVTHARKGLWDSMRVCDIQLLKDESRESRYLPDKIIKIFKKIFCIGVIVIMLLYLC